MKKKPVVEVTVETMWNYEYQAQYWVGERIKTILASDSLINLKAEIKNKGWYLAWISTSTGTMNWGQEGVSEYPYRPKY